MRTEQDVSKENVFGEVVLTMHGLGLFVGWLTEGGGYIYLLAVVLILALGIYLIKDENNRLLQLNAAEGEQPTEPADKPEKTENTQAATTDGEQPAEEKAEDK